MFNAVKFGSCIAKIMLSLVRLQSTTTRETGGLDFPQNRGKDNGDSSSPQVQARSRVLSTRFVEQSTGTLSFWPMHLQPKYHPGTGPADSHALPGSVL